MTSAAAPTTGSLPSCGRAPWAPRPVRVTVNVSDDAASAPGCATTCPTAKRRSTCPPKIAATPSSAPAASIARAPAPTSSAGCSTRRTSPSAGARRRSIAAPTIHEACTSCPQACITPGTEDAHGRPVSSPMGSASVSPRRATTGAPATRPAIRATTPVPAMRRTSDAPAPCSARSRRAAVSCSCQESSGWRCNSRRRAMSCATSSAVNCPVGSDTSAPLTSPPRCLRAR